MEVKKEQTPHQILNSQGQKLENKDEILKEYARYYKVYTFENKISWEYEGRRNRTNGWQDISRRETRSGNDNNNRNKESNQENEKQKSRR